LRVAVEFLQDCEGGDKAVLFVLTGILKNLLQRGQQLNRNRFMIESVRAELERGRLSINVTSMSLPVSETFSLAVTTFAT
jgi:hypothetical protein